MDVRDAVGAGEELRDVARRDGGARAQVRASVDPRAAAQGKDRPILLAGNLDLAIGLARVIRAEQVLASVLDPFHRPVELARRERNQVVLGIELAAHAEAAADIGLDHVDAFLGQVHALRKNPPVSERHLGRARNRHLGVRSIPDGQQAPRLHAHGGVPLHAEGFPTHIGRRIFRKRRGRVALGGGIGDRDVRSVLFEQECVIPCRSTAICDQGQGLNVEFDRVQRIFGERDTVGHDDRDRFSHVSDFGVGDDRLLERHQFRQRREPQGNGGDGAVRCLRDVVGGEGAANARHGTRDASVDRADSPVSDRGAQDRRVEHALAVQVVDELPATA